MHSLPFAAQPSDGNGIDEPAARTAATAVRVCVYAAKTPGAGVLDLLRLRLPSSAQLALIGACASSPEWPDAERVPDIVDARPNAVLAGAAQRFRGEHLVLVRADLHLPEFACERLLHALDGADVLGAVALDDACHPLLAVSKGNTIDAHRLDALCFAYSDRRAFDDPTFAVEAMPPFSAWHGDRIARLGAERLRDSDAIDASGFRVVLLDHVYVGDSVDIAKARAGDRDPRDPLPPSPLDPLRALVATAAAGDCVPARPGLDARPVLLHVLHGWGGGAERWVRDFAAADADAHHLVLIARGSFKRRLHGEWLELHDGSLGGLPLRRWPLPRAIADTAISDATYRDLLARIVRDYCVDAIVLSSLIGHSLDALRTQLPTFCVVHDHYPLWPVLHRDFGDAALRFDDAQRAADLAATGDDREFANRDPAHWHRLRDETVAALRVAKATLIAPSRSALANHLRLAPQLRELPQHVIAHGLAAWPNAAARPPVSSARARPRLLVPGRIRRGKGAELLRTALAGLREHVDLFLLGAGAEAHDLFGERGVHVVLDYRRDELPQLLAQIQPDAALLLPTVAETFSYTLSELRSLGVPVIATRVGALAERIDDGVDGFLVDAHADAVVARVVELLADPIAFDQVRSTLASHTQATPAHMARDYASIMRLGPRAPVRYPIATTDAAQLELAVATDALVRGRERERVLDTELSVARAESERRGDWGHSLDRQLVT
ncbi:MAG: glycosyltransferase, partial [Dokdonella sp.]